jgi:hypothetical protein
MIMGVPALSQNAPSTLFLTKSRTVSIQLGDM